MRRHALLAAALCLAAPLCADSADRTFRDEACPHTTSAWNRFPDWMPDAPDFWWRPNAVAVRAIEVCDHGGRFLFAPRHDGREREAALAFPRPSTRLLTERLKLDPNEERFARELAHYQRCYASLLDGLATLSDGELRGGVRRDYPAARVAPAIVFDRELELLWHGERMRLRGYLDVYFRHAVLPEVVVTYDPADSARFAEAADEPSDQEELTEFEIPEGIALADVDSLSPFLQVAPNPGHLGDYRISFAVASPGHVGLEIFDVAGRRVATLVDGSRQAGLERLRWNGRNIHGHPVTSGVYFARLTAQRHACTAKFIHLR